MLNAREIVLNRTLIKELYGFPRYTCSGSQDICGYWNAGYADDEMLKREDPLEIYRKWREFEHYMDGRQYPISILRLMKENIFLVRMGLGNPTPLLRDSLDRLGITVLDMLMEIRKWHLAVREIRTIRGRNAGCQDGRFFLKCSRVYYQAGNIDASRRFLLQAFWDQPDAIAFTDVVDAHLLGELSDLYPDYQTRGDLVETIPYIGLMTGTFSIPLEDHGAYLAELQKRSERWEQNEGAQADTRIRYRLFSLYAWQADLAKVMGSVFIEARRRMKLLDPELFQHYMNRKQGLPGL